jgi:hypothetical protein
MSIPAGWYTGEEAAELSGKSIAEIDHDAATGVIAAQYFGWQLLVSQHNPAPGPGVDEVQHVAIAGGPNGGSFTLQFGGAWTTPIPYHPSVTQLQNALTALPTIGPGNVVCGKPGNWDYDVTFQGALGHQDVALMTWDDSTLNGGTVLVTTTAPGSATRAARTKKKEFRR